MNSEICQNKPKGRGTRSKSVVKCQLAAMCLLAFACAAGAATIANVQARQRPKSDIVDVYYDLVAGEGGVFDVSVSIEGGGDKPALSTLRGDVGADVTPGRNKHIEWDAGADWPGHVQSNFVATVTAGPDLGMAFIPGGTNEGRNSDSDLGSYSLSVDSFYMDKKQVRYCVRAVGDRALNIHALPAADR